MRLLCITDLHGKASAMQRILDQAGEVDVCLLGGDITEFGTPNSAESLVRRAQRVYPDVMAVAGNCDSQAIDSRLLDLEVSLFRRGVLRGDVGFYGVSAMPPWTGRMYELTEEEMTEALEDGRSQVHLARQQVVLSHCPPRDTELDRTIRGDHVGSSSLRAFIEQYQPTLVLCGHIHEARGAEEIGATRVVNCGPAYHGHFALIEMDGDIQVELRTAEDR